MSETCRKCGGTTDSTTTTGTTGCTITSIRSDSLVVTGGCPDSGEITIELPEETDTGAATEEACTELTSLFPSDTIQVMRNGTCHFITIGNLLKALDCKRECL